MQAKLSLLHVPVNDVVFVDVVLRIPLFEVAAGNSFHVSYTSDGVTEIEVGKSPVFLVPVANEARGTNSKPELSARKSRPLLLPLASNELTTRVRPDAALSTTPITPGNVTCGDIRVELLAMEVSRDECPVTLTAMEFKLLWCFVSNPNRVLSRNDLLDRVWGYDNYPSTRTVDNHVLRLRQKLEPNPAKPVYFRTVHASGYKFVP